MNRARSRRGTEKTEHKEKNMLKRIIALTVAAMLLALAPSGIPAESARDGEPLVIDTIEILGFTAPEYGAHPDYDVGVPDGAHYYIDWSTWWLYTPGDVGRVSEEAVFDDPNALYYQEFEIWPEDGYTFPEHPTVLINGDAELVDLAYWSLNAPYFLVYSIDFEVTVPDTKPGDVDLDGEITVADALLTLRSAMGLVELTDEQQAAADCDGSGVVDAADALLILRSSMGLFAAA